MALVQHHDIPVSEEPRKRHLSLALAPQQGKSGPRRWVWIVLALAVGAVAVGVANQIFDESSAVSDGSWEVAEELRFGRIAEQQQVGDGSSEVVEQARFEGLNPNLVGDGSSEVVEQARFESLRPSDS